MSFGRHAHGRVCRAARETMPGAYGAGGPGQFVVLAVFCRRGRVAGYEFRTIFTSYSLVAERYSIHISQLAYYLFFEFSFLFY